MWYSWGSITRKESSLHFEQCVCEWKSCLALLINQGPFQKQYSNAYITSPPPQTESHKKKMNVAYAFVLLHHLKLCLSLHVHTFIIINVCDLQWSSISQLFRALFVALIVISMKMWMMNASWYPQQHPKSIGKCHPQSTIIGMRAISKHSPHNMYMLQLYHPPRLLWYQHIATAWIDHLPRNSCHTSNCVHIMPLLHEPYHPPLIFRLCCTQPIVYRYRYFRAIIMHYLQSHLHVKQTLHCYYKTG